MGRKKSASRKSPAPPKSAPSVAVSVPAPPASSDLPEVSDWALKLEETWEAPQRAPELPPEPLHPPRAPQPAEAAPAPEVQISVAKAPAQTAAPADTRSATERMAALKDLSPAAKGVENRVTDRISFKVQVDYSAVGGTSTEPAENLSTTGMFIHTVSPLEVGDAVTVSFLMPGTSMGLILPARVKWVNAFDRGGRKSGMGLEFTAMDEKKKRALATVIARIRDRGAA